MCRFNLRAVSDGGLLKKPTSLLCSHSGFDELGKLCDLCHEHTPTAGRNTKAAGIYSDKFCAAVVKCYDKHLHRGLPFEAYPSYEGDPPDDDMDGGSLIYEQTTPARTPQHLSDVDEVMGEAVPVPDDDDLDQDEGISEDPAPLPGSAAATGITFPPHVSKHTAQALRRLHQNLGHPRNADLARHLRLSGVRDDVVKAAHQLRCGVCTRHANPSTRRPAKVMVAMDFGHEVGVDTMVLHTPPKTKLNVISILDVASGYHVVKLLKGRKSVSMPG